MEPPTATNARRAPDAVTPVVSETIQLHSSTMFVCHITCIDIYDDK